LGFSKRSPSLHCGHFRNKTEWMVDEEFAMLQKYLNLKVLNATFVTTIGT
jgi:hypothetical protein